MLQLKKIVLTVIILIMLLQMTSCSNSLVDLLTSDQPYVISSQNVNDYNSDKCHFSESYFLNEVPARATIANLSYFEYYRESCEQYIELKFEDKDSLDYYLSTIKEHIISKKTSTAEYDPLFIEEKNPYDDRYIDIFYAPAHSITYNTRYTGYSIKVKANDHIDYTCIYVLISYSYDELTVIQSYTRGTFCSLEEEYVPMYLRRFNVPLDRELERLIYIDKNQ